ncbi:MAG TPA: glycosyltransferase family 9 protein [Gemmatimonadaceae bacterium]
MRLQSIENAARGVLLRLLVGLFGRGPSLPLPDWRARPYRVLVIRDDGIGDLIVSIEVLRAIAESSPTITLDLVASPQNAPVARTLPFVHEIIVHKRQFLLRALPAWRLLRRNRYDAVVDARVAVRNVNVQTTCLLLCTGAKWRIGLAGRGNDRVYTHKIEAVNLPHWTDHVVALAAPFGVAPDSRDWRPRLALPDAARAEAESAWTAVGGGRPRILVNLSVGHPERWWPTERYAPVLARARERLPNATIMIVGMPSEMRSAESLAGPVGGKAMQLSLMQVIGAVGTADLLISPDTSVTHAASAFATPTLTLQRKGTGQWSPYKTPGRVVFSDDPRKISEMPPDRVVAGLDALIDEMGRSRGWI